MKPPIAIAAQIEKLRARGLEGFDAVEAMRFLYDGNYYRLSGYWRYFQRDPGRSDNRFVQGTTLNDITRTYEFDCELSKYLFDGVADLEVALRSRLAYQWAVSAGSGAVYLDTNAYVAKVSDRGSDLREEAMESAREDVRRSKEKFIRHHLGGDIPLWAAVETFSFGTTPRIFELIANTAVVDAVAKSFGLNRTTASGSFHSFAVLRNICAHHGRIWNRVPARAVPVPYSLRSSLNSAELRSPFAWIVALKSLVDGIRRDHSYSEDIDAYLGRYPEMLEGLMHPRET